MTWGSRLVMGQTTLECNAGDIRGSEEYFGTSNAWSYDDRGGNDCGCGAGRVPCEAQSF